MNEQQLPPWRVLWNDLAAAGLTMAADGPRLLVSPSSRITPELATRIKKHKADLLAELSWLANPPQAAIAAMNGWTPFTKEVTM